MTLTWKKPRGGTEPEAYLVFRDGRRIARTKRRTYVDRRAKPGRHRYVVVAVDAKGRRGRPSQIVRARVPARAPALPAPPAGPDPPPLPAPNLGSTLTAAMVDRLFWRAGFGATQAQRDAWTGRGHLNLVDWLLDTPASLGPDGDAAADAASNGGSTRWRPRTSSSWSGWTACSARSIRCASASRSSGTATGPSAATTASRSTWLLAYRDRLLRVADPAQSFRQLAWEMTTTDAAMSMYLNGNQNVRGRPNENYARELMELFCLGPTAPNGDPNYTQDDVAGLARALTGWRLNSDDTSPNYGRVTFSTNHFESGRQERSSACRSPRSRRPP